MRNFFSRYSYGMVRMFIYQFAIGLFGAVLAMATMPDENGSRVLLIIAGVFSVLFYLFLIYTMTWEIGAKDRISIDCGKLDSKPYRGVLISLCANLPNFIIAIVYSIARIVPPINDPVEVWTRAIATFSIDGMYTAFLSLRSPTGTALVHYWWMYFVIIIPAVATAGIAYWLGSRNVHFTKMMETQYPESDREPKKKWFGKDK